MSSLHSPRHSHLSDPASSTSLIIHHPPTLHMSKYACKGKDNGLNTDVLGLRRSPKVLRRNPSSKQGVIEPPRGLRTETRQDEVQPMSINVLYKSHCYININIPLHYYIMYTSTTPSV